MLDYLHVLTLCSWLPLALLASVQERRSNARRFLWWLCGATLLLCCCILYLDFVWSKTVVAPIRIDLLLVIPVTTITFTGVGLWGLRRPGVLAKIAGLSLLALSLPTLVVFAQRMRSLSRDSEQIRRRPALIYEAQFRNPETFRNFFGGLDKPDDPRVGHFQAVDARSWASRVIINADGHFWLLFKCDTNVECLYAQAELSRPLPGTFKAQPSASAPIDIVVSEWNPERLTLSVAPTRGFDTFVRSPVPYQHAATSAGAVHYHGAFAQSRIEGGYVHLVQVWLWQSGDRWLGYYLRQTGKCGSTNGFVFASAYDGKRVSDRIDLVRGEGESSNDSLSIQRPTPASELIEGQVMFRGNPLETVALKRGSALRSPIYDSAPLTDLATTSAWLKTVSMGYDMQWTAECPGSD